MKTIDAFIQGLNREITFYIKIIYTNKINEVVKIKNDPFILLNKNCISQEKIIKYLNTTLSMKQKDIHYCLF